MTQDIKQPVQTHILGLTANMKLYNLWDITWLFWYVGFFLYIEKNIITTQIRVVCYNLNIIPNEIL